MAGIAARQDRGHPVGDRVETTHAAREIYERADCDKAGVDIEGCEGEERCGLKILLAPVGTLRAEQLYSTGLQDGQDYDLGDDEAKPRPRPAASLAT